MVHPFITDAQATQKIQEIYNDIVNSIGTGFQGTIKIADTPTEEGVYIPTEAGVYPNAGGLEYAPEGDDEGFLVQFIFDGSEWVKSRVELDIPYLNEITHEIRGLKGESKLTIDGYINPSGSIGPSTQTKSTDYISCRGSLKLRITQPVWTSSTANTGVAFYKEDKSFLSFVNILNNQPDYGWEEKIIDIPNEAFYFRTSYWDEEFTSLHNFPDFYCYIDDLFLVVDKLSGEVSFLNKNAEPSVFLTSKDLILKNSAILSDGNMVNSTLSDSTDYVKCSDIKKLNVMFQITDGSTQFFNFAFYDENKGLVSSISANVEASRGWELRSLEVPENAHYFRAQYWNEERRMEYDAPEFYAYSVGIAIQDVYRKIELSNDGLKPVFDRSDLSVKGMYFDFTRGELRVSDSQDSTGFLNCRNFSTLTLIQPIWESARSSGIGFFDKNFNFISARNNTSDGVGFSSEEVTVEVPENAHYFRTTYWNEATCLEHDLPDFYVIAGTISDNINEIYDRLRTSGLSEDFSVTFTPEQVIVINTKTQGSLIFNLVGTDTVTGNFSENTLHKGGKLIRKIEDGNRIMHVTFDLTDSSTALQIYTYSIYKKDSVIENDGIFATSSGDMGFIKDVNMFVEGNPMIAGFTNEERTQFALCSDNGSFTPHYDKLQEIHFTDIDILKGEKRFAKISVLKDETPIRLLNQPNGYNATFTFASHADSATVPITKAIFYGTENEASPTYDTNGLLSYGIKGTMSVFAEGHVSSRAALDNASFKALIDDAYSKGIEIIPHTITYNPDTRADAERALPFFKENYNSRNWIDHLLRQNNPSIGLHSLGNDPESPHYIMDLMQQFGYEYTWSYVDTTPDGVIREQLFDEHFQFRRDLLYKNKQLAFPDGTPMWQYKNTWKVFESIMGGSTDAVGFVQDIIDNCGVWSDHPYLTATYGQLWKEVGGVISIDPKFDQMLAFVRDKKEAGEIWNPTQSEYNDHMVKLLNIEIVRTGTGQYKVFSHNDTPTNCSFLLKNTFKPVYLNGELMSSKVSGGNLIFWADINPGENSIVVN